MLATSNSRAIGAQDYYVIRFLNLALSNNAARAGLHAGEVSYPNGASPGSGDAVLLVNIGALVVQPASPGVPLNGAQLTISANVWRNPDHYLMDNFTSAITGQLVLN